MQFTKYQYDTATAALIDGSTQLEPDGRACTICGDDGHQAWECSRNPLRAMYLVNKVVSTARDLHEQLHVLGGYYNCGPSAGIEAIVPEPVDPETIELSFEQLVGATSPAPQDKPTNVNVRMANAGKLQEVAVFVPDDQGGHIMFGGLCWRPVRS